MFLQGDLPMEVFVSRFDTDQQPVRDIKTCGSQITFYKLVTPSLANIIKTIYLA